MLNLMRITATLGVFALVGCTAPPPEAEEFDQQAVEAEIIDWLDTFWETWREGGAGFDRGMAFYDDHPDFAFASEGAMWRSLSDATETFRPAFETIQSQMIELEETAITVLSQDLVYVLEQGTYSATDMGGNTSEATPFAFSSLLVRTDAGWKLRFGHQSEPAPE
jgi:hypothetical protein